MKILIIEDENIAIRNLRYALHEIDPGIEIVAELENVADSLKWFSTNSLESIDVILSDIQLSDGLSFDIFERINGSVPIIFITAYDEFAIRAFKVNGIDYLLKPINSKELRDAINKFKNYQKRYSKIQLDDIQNIIRNSVKPVTYRTSFVSYRNDRFIPIMTERITCFFIVEQVTYALLSDRQQAILDESLDEIETSLDPQQFFRANRQMIISRKAIVEAQNYFGNRLIVKLNPPVHEKIIISKERAPKFRKWLGEG